MALDGRSLRDGVAARDPAPAALLASRGRLCKRPDYAQEIDIEMYLFVNARFPFWLAGERPATDRYTYVDWIEHVSR